MTDSTGRPDTLAFVRKMLRTLYPNADITDHEARAVAIPVQRFLVTTRLAQ